MENLSRTTGSPSVGRPALASSGTVGARRIRVLHVVDKLTIGGAAFHGVARLLSWWVPAYDRKRFEVTVVSLRGRDHAGQRLEQAGVDMLYLGRGRFDPRTLIDLLRLARRKRADVLHLHGYGACTFGRMAARLLDLPAIVHEHMEDCRVPWYQRLADRVLSGSTTHSLAVSESVKRFLVLRRGLPAHRVETLYNGVPLAEFDAPFSRAAVRAELDIPPGHLAVAIVGRLHEIKGHVYLLEAARHVLRRHPDVTFLVVGDGALREPLESQAASLGLGDRVRFVGHRDDIPRLLRAVDIKVIPSLSEGVPLTLFEAMAAGCAVVATRVGGLAEVLYDGLNGLLVPPADARSLSAAIERLIDEPSLRQALAANARAASRHYDIAETVRRQEQLYRRLVGPRGQRS